MRGICMLIIGFLIVVISVLGIVALSDESPRATGATAAAIPIPPQQPAVTPAEQDYLNTIAAQTTMIADTWSELGVLFGDYQPMSDEWTVQVAAHLATMQLVCAEAMKLSPPSSLVTIHSIYIQGLSHVELATGLIIEALDTLDSNLLNQAIAELRAGNQLIDQAAGMILQFGAAHGTTGIETWHGTDL